jgi:Arc/MetJ-type ribon-helix-helix transcriptional regulator
MNKKTPLTVTIEPHLRAYAERLVSHGKAASISAVVNHALAEQYARDKRAMALWKSKAEEAEADPQVMARVERMQAHVEAQLSRLGLGSGSPSDADHTGNSGSAQASDQSR